MKKGVDHQQFIETVEAAVSAHLKIAALWKTAMQTMLINSREYQSICAMGRSSDKVILGLRNAAEDRGLTDEDIESVFGDALREGISFS